MKLVHSAIEFLEELLKVADFSCNSCIEEAYEDNDGTVWFLCPKGVEKDAYCKPALVKAAKRLQGSIRWEDIVLPLEREEKE